MRIKIEDSVIKVDGIVKYVRLGEDKWYGIKEKMDMEFGEVIDGIGTLIGEVFGEVYGPAH